MHWYKYLLNVSTWAKVAFITFIHILPIPDRKIQAFIYDATPLEYHAGNDDNCELKTVGEKYAMTGYGIAVPKKASYLEEINDVILELQETGTTLIIYRQHK